MPHTTATSTMKAMVQSRYGPTSMLEMQETERPEIGDDDVLVRVHAAGVDPSVWHLMSGEPYLVRIMGFGLRAPKNPVPGSDLAGRVVAVGANVTRFRPGDEVFGVGVGAFAEYARTREANLHHKPDGLSFVDAAAATVSGVTALQALHGKGRVADGQSVLVIGAGGGVGTYAVQIAKAVGARVTGVCSTGKVDLVRSIGADDVIDYTRDDLDDGRHRYDLILDIAGNRPLRSLRRALRPDGALVIVGGEEGGRWLGGTQRLLGAAVTSLFVGQRLLGLFSTIREEDLRELARLLEAGQIRPVVDRTFRLEEAPDAIDYVQQGRARGKVVLTV